MNCNMISIDADILSHINMQELSSVASAVKLYNRVVEEGVLIAPKCQQEDYDDLNMCRWHFSASHSISNYKSFKGFINKKMRA